MMRDGGSNSLMIYWINLRSSEMRNFWRKLICFLIGHKFIRYGEVLGAPGYYKCGCCEMVGKLTPKGWKPCKKDTEEAQRLQDEHFNHLMYD